MACFPHKIQLSWNCVAEVILSISFRDTYWKINTASAIELGALISIEEIEANPPSTWGLPVT